MQVGKRREGTTDCLSEADNVTVSAEKVRDQETEMLCRCGAREKQKPWYGSPWTSAQFFLLR